MQLHDGVRSRVLTDLRLHVAVRSEAYFEGLLEHPRQPKLSKKSPGSKQDGQKGAPGVGRTTQKTPGRPKGSFPRWPRRPKGNPGSRQDEPKGAQGAGKTAQKAPRKTKRSIPGAILGTKFRLKPIFAEMRFTSALPMRQALQTRPDAPQSGPETPKGRPESRQDGPEGKQSAQRTPREQAEQPQGRPASQAGRPMGRLKVQKTFLERLPS